MELRHLASGTGPHTNTPIAYDNLKDYYEDALLRTFFLVTDEAGGADMAS